MQLCQNCGRESEETDKFCSHCGRQFGVETEFTSAPTMSQGAAGPNPVKPVFNTGRFPPSVGDVVAGETPRYYYQPQYAAAPVVYPQDIYAPKPSPSPWLRAIGGFFKGLLFLIFIGGLIGATAAAVFFSQEVRREREERHRLQSKLGNTGGDNANGRAQTAWTQMEEALVLIHEAEEKAALAGATLPGANTKSMDLTKFAFPGAKLEATITGPGSGAISMLTEKDLEAVRTFYESQFGRPVIQMSEGPSGDSRKKLLFQSSTTPPVLIKAEDVDDNQVKITIFQSPLQFTKSGDAQPAK